MDDTVAVPSHAVIPAHRKPVPSPFYRSYDLSHEPSKLAGSRVHRAAGDAGLKIAYVSSARLPSGLAHGTQIVRMCEAFSRLGHDATLIHRQSRREYSGQTIVGYYGCRDAFRTVAVPEFRITSKMSFLPGPVRKPISYLAGIRWQRKAAEVALGLDADCYVVRDMTPHAARRLAESGGKLAIEFHGVSPDPLVRRALANVMSHPVNVRGFAVTSLLARDAENWLRLRPGALAVLHDGVDLAAFDHPAGRPRVGNRPVVTYAGSLLPNRGVDLLVEAALQCSEFDFEVVGGPAERMVALQQEAQKVGASNITFTGRIPNRDIPQRMSGADLLVLPMRGNEVHTIRHASPLKLFEYMASGVPIVATDLPSIREVVRDGETACLVEPDNVEALVFGIRRLIRNREHAATMAANAKREVAKFSWTHRAEEMIGGWEDSDIAHVTPQRAEGPG